MRTLIFLLVACFATAASSDPVITKVTASTVSGANFGTQPGTVWIRAIAKLTAKQRAAGVDERNLGRFLGRMPLKVNKWGSTAIQFTFTATDRYDFLYVCINRAADSGITLGQNDFEFKYQVERPVDGAASPWF